MKGSLNLGKILGIKVLIHYTFLLLFVFIGYYVYDETHSIGEVLYMFLIVIISFVCVLMHEYGHALAARRIGIETRQILILPIGGMAQLNNMPEKPRDELFVTICGPLVNVGIVLVLLPFAFLNHTMQNLLQMINEGVNLEYIKAAISNNLLLMVIALNIGLFLFNLIPAYPMDGGRIFRALLAYKFKYLNATLIAARTGQIIASTYFVFILFTFVQEQKETADQKKAGQQIYLEQPEPIQVKKDDDKLTYFGVVRLFVLCGFIVSLAEMEYRMVKRKDELGGYDSFEQIMQPTDSLYASNSIMDAMNMLAVNPRNNLTITNLGTVAGSITTKLPGELDHYRNNDQIPSSTHRFSPGDSLGHALQMMDILGIPVLDMGNMFTLPEGMKGVEGYYLIKQV
jgi:Zn-dependent protease